MTDPVTPPFSTGGLYREDPRDWPISQLFAAAGLEPAAAVDLPPAYADRTMPRVPILNQGNTPRCVSFGLGEVMIRHELLDRGRVLDFDEAKFAGQIGTTAEGAYIGTGLEQLVDFGYPTVGHTDRADHKLKAYYRVANGELALKQALVAFGPLAVIGQWHRNWYSPPASGILPAAGMADSGHCTVLWGWDETGFLFRNSWGAAWGNGGNFTIRYAELASYLWAAYKTVDVQAFASRTVACTVPVRATPNLGVRLGTIRAGTRIRVKPSVAGARWTTACPSASSHAGNQWVPIAVINGKAVGLVYPGHDRVYVKAGAVK